MKLEITLLNLKNISKLSLFETSLKIHNSLLELIKSQILKLNVILKRITKIQ